MGRAEQGFDVDPNPKTVCHARSRTPATANSTDPMNAIRYGGASVSRIGTLRGRPMIAATPSTTPNDAAPEYRKACHGVKNVSSTLPWACAQMST